MIDHAMQLIIHKGALLKEIEFLKTQLRDHDTGHIRTAIYVLEERVEDIVEFLNETDKKSKHLMNGITNWDKIMSTPGNL
jgi:ribosomal 50S subunit-associated protein YjgA (DUF615 family)